MDKQLRTGIVASLIAGLALLFIQPIFNLLWHLILNIGGTLHHGYVDGIYRNAARTGDNPYGKTTFFVLFLVFAFVGLFWALEDIKRGPASASFPRLATLVARLTWLVVLIALLTVFVQAAIIIGTGEIAESFTQRLTILAPGISDSEYKILRARWANMQGKADYDAIAADMDKRAVELGVKLPPVR